MPAALRLPTDWIRSQTPQIARVMCCMTMAGAIMRLDRVRVPMACKIRLAIRMAATIQMMVDVANIGGMGFDNLRWLRPVHPNEPLDVELTVNSVTPSKSKPDRGVLHYTLSAKNPEGEVVFSTDTPVMIQRKQNDTD